MSGTDRTELRPWRLWFGVGAGPLVWAAHFSAAYLLVTWACIGTLPWSASLWLHGVTVLALIVIVVAGVLSWRAWRALGTSFDSDFEDGNASRKKFMAMSGTLLNIWFFVVIATSDVTLLTLPSCG